MFDTIIEILILWILIIILNRFVVPWIVHRIAEFHRKNNQKNLNKHPVKFLLTHEDKSLLYSGIFIGSLQLGSPFSH